MLAIHIRYMLISAGVAVHLMWLTDSSLTDDFGGEKDQVVGFLSFSGR